MLYILIKMLELVECESESSLNEVIFWISFEGLVGSQQVES